MPVPSLQTETQNTRGPRTWQASGLYKEIRNAAILILLALICSLVLLALDPSARALLQPPKLGPDEVLFATASQWNPVWIDARSRGAYEANHIQGAHLLTLDASENFEQLLFDLDASQLLDGSRPVVVYCSSSSCQLSREVAARLRERYPTLKVFVLHGGWEGLLKTEFPG